MLRTTGIVFNKEIINYGAIISFSNLDTKSVQTKILKYLIKGISLHQKKKKKKNI